ncbi:MAG: zinc ribbon domain-containing protein [Mediterranea massiliensis]|nr:zinc ribbon domain-containing protein [Mediterranea massiliensis]
MTAKDIFMKTLAFCWAKLGLGLLNILICVILFAILMGISLLFASESVTGIMFFVWLALVGVVNFVINHYFGYMLKAGHVAVIAQTVKEGRVPANCVSVGKKMVVDRFGTANAYFAIDKLISGAVKQLQRSLGRISNSLFGAIPGADSVKSAANFFLDISLGYIDECCLSYTFYRNDQNAYKSACDGVVIYAQNWKHLLKNAAMTALTVVVSMLLVTLVAFLIFGGIFRLLGWSGFVAFVLALMMAGTVKFAFIDSWIMVKMMHGYMQVAPTTVMTFDLYSKLSGLSEKFKELYKNGTVSSSYATRSVSTHTTVQQPLQEAMNDAKVAPQTAEAASGSEASATATKPRFCSECGTTLQLGVAFCGSCGTKIE